MTGIIDYNAGNIPSVARALDALGCEYIVSKSPQELETVDRLIFPGVGDAQFAMQQLKSSGFDAFLKDKAASVPILGICLGSQIIFDESDEGCTPCLGLLAGRIRHFSSVQPGFPLKVPHMGWNDLAFTEEERRNPCRLLDGIPEGSSFYFVHSYVIQPKEPTVVRAVADYGLPVPAVIHSGNVFAVQFHPEKSGAPGLRLLRNFVQLGACDEVESVRGGKQC